MEKLLKCSTCKEYKPEESFSIDKYTVSRGRNYRCRECISKWKKQPEVRKKLNEREAVYRSQGKNKLARRKRRIDAIEKLGGKCECCGEARLEFLAIDHIAGLSRRKIDEAGDGLVMKVRKSGFSKEVFRILCHNCNSSLGFYGYCPHKTNKNFLTR